jgi:hypothetical protein
MDEVLSQNADVNLAPAGSDSASSPQEKMIPQSQLNEIVGRVRQEANAKLEEFKRSQDYARQQAAQTQQSSSQPSVNDDYVRKIIAEEASRYRNEAQMQANEEAAKRVVDSFYSKIEAGKQKYEDFDAVTGDVLNPTQLRRYPNIVQMLAESIDNSHDVLYELSKNREKLVDLELKAKADDGAYYSDVLHALQRLSNSIKKNDEASSSRQANAPLSQQRPSNVGTDSGRTLSMRDLKAKYRV